MCHFSFVSYETIKVVHRNKVHWLGHYNSSHLESLILLDHFLIWSSDRLCVPPEWTIVGVGGFDHAASLDFLQQL